MAIDSANDQHPERHAIGQLMQHFSIETTPNSAQKVDDFSKHLPAGTCVYVTSLPDTDFSTTLNTCIRLKNEGMNPVPHFTARSIQDANDLETRIRRTTEEAGVNRVLVLAGADKVPRGEFSDSISLLETGLFDRYGIKSIGIAGHPEGSPDIDHPLLRQHGELKIDYAEVTDSSMYLVTQFVFEADPVIRWIERIRREGNQLPVHVGIPGIATLKTLIGHAKACGIGASMKVLTRQAKNIHKLLLPQSPDRLVRELAQQMVEKPDLNIAALHMFPLGGFVKTSDWCQHILDQKFKFTEHGFEVS